MLNKITKLKKQIIIQSATVEFMFDNFIQNLIEKNKQKLKEIFLMEKRVNEKEIAIEEEAIELIALNQPEAKNLRTIVMAMKMNNDLERVGDLITDMTSFYISHIKEEIFVDIKKLILMAKRAQEMLSESIQSFEKENVDIANNVCKKDDFVDELHRELRDEIIEFIKENPAHTRKMFDFYSIIFKIERIADLATNIAEEAIYLSAGKDIKHGQFNV